MPEIIPNWHPILVNFTIALLATATLLFVVRALMGRDRPAGGLETVANWNLWLGAAVTLATLAAGLQAAGSVAHDEAAHAAMENHKYWALATATLFALLALWNSWRLGQKRAVGLAFAAALLVALVSLAATGLRGADLVFSHGLGVMAMPEAGGAGHSHEGGAEQAREDSTAAAPPPAMTDLTPAQSEVVAALTAFHDALTINDVAAVERFVVADERFVMIEGNHTNFGWADYRDNHLKGELKDLCKVRFRLTVYRVQLAGTLAYVSYRFNILPKEGPERDFGKGIGTAVLVATDGGWKIQHLHTS